MLKKSSGALNHLFQSITFELKISGRFVKEKPRSLSLNRTASIFLTMKKLLCLLENNASINVKLEGGGGGGNPGICGAFDFSREFWSKSPPWGPEILVKSDQISPPSQWIEDI